MSSLDPAPAPGLAADRIELLQSQLFTVFAGNVAASSALAAIVWAVGDHATIITWTGAIYALTLVRWVHARTCRARELSDTAARRFGRIFIAFSVLSGCIWGSAGVVLLVPDSPVHLIAVVLILLGMAAGAVGSLSTLLGAYAGFAVPGLLPLMFHFLLLREPGFTILGVLVGVFLLVNLAYARNVHRSLLDSLRRRYENLDLVSQLREQTALARRASQDKSRFLAAASHDLRQPLHALGLFLDSLEARLQDPRSLQIMGDVHRCVEALRVLFDALLDVSRLDAGIVEVHRRDFALRGLLDAIRAEYGAVAGAKGLVLDLNAADVVVHSDPVLVGRILRNLIENALSYTEHGSVRVRVAVDGAAVRVAVADTGPGIPDEESTHIFSEFYQLANPERDRAKGLGLGLAIVRRLGALLDHRVTVQSPADGGATFTVELPLGDRARVSERSNDARRPAWQLDGAHVLVIDDEADIRRAMEEVLRSWACRVSSAPSAEEAVRALDAGEAPDVVIADYRLREGLSGIDAIERVREASGRPVPALLITGDTAPERLEEARRSGLALLHKPVPPGALRMAVNRILIAARAGREDTPASR